MDDAAEDFEFEYEDDDNENDATGADVENKYYTAKGPLARCGTGLRAQLAKRRISTRRSRTSRPSSTTRIRPATGASSRSSS